MRRLLLLPLTALLLLDGSTADLAEAIGAHPIHIAATPVALYPDRPSARRVGRLRFLGGWALTSRERAFGGLSALARVGDHFIALSDIGAFVRFTLGDDGRVRGAAIAPLPTRCAYGPLKSDRDTEALVVDNGRAWVSFESRNAICRLGPGRQVAVARYRPPAIRRWPRTGGPEAMARLPGGAFLIFSETGKGPDGSTDLLLFDRDPTDPAARVARFGYRAPAGFRATDAVRLDDGRLLVLNRRFGLAYGFTNALTLVDPAGAKPGQVIGGPVIARLEPPTVHDNFEGLALGRDRGLPVLWMVSDDNFMRWQRTLLLEFAVDLPPRQGS